jgi:hypothetical protein
MIMCVMRKSRIMVAHSVNHNNNNTYDASVVREGSNRLDCDDDSVYDTHNGGGA